jgi:hypothetical protein
MLQARAALAANDVVGCGRLQRTLKDGQVDRRDNCRGMNPLEVGTCAVTLAGLAATTRGSPGTRPSQPVERTANAKPAEGPLREDAQPLKLSRPGISESIAT